jgi:SMODS and SLOG-associating 2TM effector domain
MSSKSSTSPNLSDDHFYALIGIQKPSNSNNPDPPLKMRQDGLYRTINDKERWINVQYHLFSVGVYVLLGAQLLLSAVFVILGSLHNVDSHLTIAILGAVGTVIAGTLAFMKGQGQPDRLRRTRNALRDVKLQAKRLYLDFGGGIPATQQDIDKLWEHYISVVKTEEMNHPDTPIGLAKAASPGANGALPGLNGSVPGIGLTPGTGVHNF